MIETKDIGGGPLRSSHDILLIEHVRWVESKAFRRRPPRSHEWQYHQHPLVEVGAGAAVERELPWSCKGLVAWTDCNQLSDPCRCDSEWTHIYRDAFIARPGQMSRSLSMYRTKAAHAPDHYPRNGFIVDVEVHREHPSVMRHFVYHRERWVKTQAEAESLAAYMMTCVDRLTRRRMQLLYRRFKGKMS